MLIVDDSKIRKWYEEFMGELSSPDWGDNAVSLAVKGTLGVERPLQSLIKDMVIASRHQDWLMHLTKKRYRDHHRHQCYVSILGLHFLRSKVGCSIDCGEKKEETFLEYASSITGLLPEKVEAAWWIASLLHDHAYPLAHLAQSMCCFTYLNEDKYEEDLLEYIQFTRSYRGLFNDALCEAFLETFESDEETREEMRRNRILGAVKKYLSPFGIELPFKPHDSDNLEEFYDHGLWGALNLAIQAKKKAGLMPAMVADSLCFQCALQAIVRHS